MNLDVYLYSLLGDLARAQELLHNNMHLWKNLH